MLNSLTTVLLEISCVCVNVVLGIGLLTVGVILDSVVDFMPKLSMVVINASWFALIDTVVPRNQVAFGPIYKVVAIIHFDLLCRSGLFRGSHTSGQ